MAVIPAVYHVSNKMVLTFKRLKFTLRLSERISSLRDYKLIDKDIELKENQPPPNLRKILLIFTKDIKTESDLDEIVCKSLLPFSVLGYRQRLFFAHLIISKITRLQGTL